MAGGAGVGIGAGDGPGTLRGGDGISSGFGMTAESRPGTIGARVGEESDAA